MTSFHNSLNRMAFFTAFILCGIAVFYRIFLAVAVSNIYLNGIIIGTTLFGILLCFFKVFALLPEYRWLNAYSKGLRTNTTTPRLLHSVALLLHKRRGNLSENGLRGIMDAILVRLEDDRESIRYITNTLVFLGLLGTFWGLILTIGGFADLIRNLNFNDETVLQTMQAGLSRPLGGMATAFTSSLLGLGGSLIVGFLGLQVQLAQSAIFKKLEDFLSARTNVFQNNTLASALPKIESALDKINNTVQSVNDKIQG